MASNHKRTITDLLTLSNNVKIPQLGFGVYRSPKEVCANSCLSALKAGYRHIDTAQFYANEAEVGEAIRASGFPRSELFITTKILTAAGSVEKSYDKCVESARKIGGQNGYVDAFLVHSPNSGSAKRKEMWQAIEKIYEEGKAKSIGVSNYGIKHFEEMKQYAKVWPPHILQIELHPWLQQRDVVEYCHKHGIVVEAYCPLVRNYKSNDETLVGVAKRHNVTSQQVLVRYCLQKGWVPLPKSDNPERIKANADVYGFDLSNEDMATLDDLDQGDEGAIVQAVDNY